MTTTLNPAPGPGPWQSGILAFTTLCDSCHATMHAGDRHVARTTGQEQPGPNAWMKPKAVYERRCLACAETTGVLPAAEQEAS